MVKATFALLPLAALCASAIRSPFTDTETYEIDGFDYLGCYYEPNSLRMLNDTCTSRASILPFTHVCLSVELSYSMSECQTYCKRINMRYAGTGTLLSLPSIATNERSEIGDQASPLAELAEHLLTLSLVLLWERNQDKG